MERKKFNKIKLTTTIIIVLIIAIAAIKGDMTITLFAALVAVVIGMLILLFAKKRIKQVIEDERIYRISEKASRRTIQIIGTTTALLGIIILILSQIGYLKSSELGFSLVYIAIAILWVYMIFYSYYSKKMGD